MLPIMFDGWKAQATLNLSPEAEAEMARLIKAKRHFDRPGFTYAYSVFLCRYHADGDLIDELVTIHSTWEKAVTFCFVSEDAYLETMRVDPKLFWYWVIIRKQVDNYQPGNIPEAFIRYQKEIHPNPYDLGFAAFATLLLEDQYQWQQWWRTIDVDALLRDSKREFSMLTNLFYQFCLAYGITEKEGYLEMETAEWVLAAVAPNIPWLQALKDAPDFR